MTLYYWLTQKRSYKRDDRVIEIGSSYGLSDIRSEITGAAGTRAVFEKKGVRGGISNYSTGTKQPKLKSKHLFPSRTNTPQARHYNSTSLHPFM